MSNYKKGDRVKVWSLQSFFHGGFLKGEPAVVKQDQTGDSVIVAVVRNIGGVYKLDESYEVYDKQLERYSFVDEQSTSYKEARKQLEVFANNLLNH